MNDFGAESFPTFDPTFEAIVQSTGEYCPPQITNATVVSQETKVARGQGRTMTGASHFHEQSVSHDPSRQRERVLTTMNITQSSVTDPISSYRCSATIVDIPDIVLTTNAPSSSRRRSSAIVSNFVRPPPGPNSGSLHGHARPRNGSVSRFNALDDPYGTADPFFGASEPLLATDSSHTCAISYSNPWTSAEDGALMAFRQRYNLHEWDALRKAWHAAYPHFPARELSDMIARWRFLGELRSLKKADKRHIWVLRNSTVPETWHDICRLMVLQGKDVDLTIVIEAEREWGYYLNINNLGFRWPQPDLRGTLFPDDREAVDQFELTLRDQLIREYDLVLAMYYDGDRDSTAVAEHFLEKGIRWEEEEVMAILDGYGRYDRSARTRLIFGKVIGPAVPAHTYK